MRLTLTKIFSFVFIEPYTFNWVAGAIIGGSLIGGAASKKGAEAGSDAAGAATAEERRQFDLTWDANEKYREAGANALNNMSILTGGEGRNPIYSADGEELRVFIDKFRRNERGQHGYIDKLSDVEILRLLQKGDISKEWEDKYRNPTTTAEDLVKQDPSYQFRFDEGMDATQNALSSQNRRMGGSAIKGMMDYGQNTASNEYSNIFNRNATIAGYGPGANQTPQNQISSGIINQGNVQTGKYSAYNNAIQGGIQNYLTYDAQQNSGYTQPNTSYSDGSSGFTPNQSSIGYWDQQ